MPFWIRYLRMLEIIKINFLPFVRFFGNQTSNQGEFILENLSLIILAGLLAVAYSYILSKQIISSNTGNNKMQEIAEAIQIGAKAYLKSQYKNIAI